MAKKRKKPCPARIRKPDPEQIRALQRDMDNLVEEVPEIAELFDLLLSMGGHAVVPVKEEDLVKILERGYLLEGRGAKKMPGEPIKCHTNAALLWDANKDRSVIVTGWAMSSDGLWRQHSWVRDTETDQIYETTLPRELYFGFDMTPEEAAKFLQDNLY